MRLIDVNVFLERERYVDQWRALTNYQVDVLKEFHDGGPTKYVILSHRWGKDSEVDYVEMVYLMSLKKSDRDEVRARDGYQKILNSCRQAKADRIEWLWVDSCCIDKRSSSELSEAINSMYRWYENSTICYAHLHDFEGPSFPTVPNIQKFSAFSGWPEWFSRGWTLQELIAPRNLQFFNKHWQSIGSKEAYANNINEITRVPRAVLVDGLAANRPCVAQIMSWASDRKTTRIEDRAYSLLGLLDVNMPMLYGEGKEAFLRLQLEIIRKSDDQSIFAWIPDRSVRWNSSGVLADDPSFFKDCHDVERMDLEEYMIHLQERLPDEESRSLSLADERLDTCSVTNRGIQIWFLVTPYDHCPTVFFRAILACCKWDRRPMTIDLALWGLHYYRCRGTTGMPKGIPIFKKLNLCYQLLVHPDLKFELGGYCGMHSVLQERGFIYRGSIPPAKSLDSSESLVLSGVNELLVAVYDGQSGNSQFVVVFGYSFGREWVRVIVDDRVDGTWQEYAESTYNKVWKERLHDTAISTGDHIHIHIVSSVFWSGWAINITRSPEGSSESASRSSTVKILPCGRECYNDPGRNVGVFISGRMYGLTGIQRREIAT